jgi:hypothetical protein
MKLVFIYGAPAAGKLTIARRISALTAFPVFHNHLIVDAVSSVFPFGTPTFVTLREAFWLTVICEAAREARSLLFTFAPESTVSSDFPVKAQQAVEQTGGSVAFVRLTVSPMEQERRLGEASRREFDKMRSIKQLRQLRGQFEACEENMPRANLTIDTTEVSPQQAAFTIVQELGLAMRS